MISQKKLEANRRKVQKSTGPKTDAGKAVTRMNQSIGKEKLFQVYLSRQLRARLVWPNRIGP